MNTADQYLRAIYLIRRSTEAPAATGEIADALGVSPASATEMVGKLEERGLADHEKYNGVRLTDEGVDRARDALRTYCIIERFLANVLEVEEFRDEARSLEAVIDDTVAERLDAIVARDPSCPDCFAAETDACGLLDLPAEREPEAD